ncbi:hypothetical protein SRABI91_01665 [Rhodococcoides fascians]|nr:hypothetical protein SRABI91_01665 [Rhodococcus fascians]
MSAEQFPHLTDRQLMARMEQAADFKYDDEALELTRRLGERALSWRWSDDFFNPKVEVYKPEAEQQPKRSTYE